MGLAAPLVFKTEATDLEFRINYELLKAYIALVVTPDKLAGLNDHKEPCKHLTSWIAIIISFVMLWLALMLWSGGYAPHLLHPQYPSSGPRTWLQIQGEGCLWVWETG